MDLIHVRRETQYSVLGNSFYMKILGNKLNYLFVSNLSKIFILKMQSFQTYKAVLSKGYKS